MKKAVIMLVCFMLGILIASIVGCGVPTRGPNFCLYDKVVVGNAVGIVTKTHKTVDGGWRYTVLVRSTEILMEERDLVLHERMDWNETPKTNIPPIIIEFGTPTPVPDHSVLKDRTA